MKTHYNAKYLDSLFTKAIRKKYNNSCVICDRFSLTLEVHHIVHRWNDLLRWDLENGVTVCENILYDCHVYADSKEGQKFLEKIVDMEYLNKTKIKSFKDYLLENNLTKREFVKNKIRELKEHAQDHCIKI